MTNCPVEAEMTKESRANIYALYLDVCVANSIYDSTDRYCDYILDNYTGMQIREIAGCAKVRTLLAQENFQEALNNHSKACELVGDLERARTETEESYPLLCNIYGAEHRKSVEAKERLERLSKE